MDPQISAGYYGQNTLFQRWRYDTNRLLVDADSAGNVDIKRSTIGYVYRVCLYSRRYCSELGFSMQKIVALSTTEAEYVAITEASKEMVWLQSFLEELGKKQEDNVLYCDSQSDKDRDH